MEEKDAVIEIKLKSKSGFNQKIEGKISSTQWALINRILEDWQLILLNAELILELHTKNQWINRVPDCLPEKRYFKEEFLFIDSHGNKMHCGGDFSAAEKLDSYPVRVYRLKTASQSLEEKQVATENK